MQTVPKNGRRKLEWNENVITQNTRKVFGEDAYVAHMLIVFGKLRSSDHILAVDLMA